MTKNLLSVPRKSRCFAALSTEHVRKLMNHFMEYRTTCASDNHFFPYLFREPAYATFRIENALVSR